MRMSEVAELFGDDAIRPMFISFPTCTLELCTCQGIV